MVPEMLLALGGPLTVGVVVPLVCAMGERMEALVIEGSVVDVGGGAAALLLTLEAGGPVALTMGVPGGRVITGRFGTPLHMF